MYKMFKIFVSINAFLFVLYCHSMDQEGVPDLALKQVYDFNIKKNEEYTQHKKKPHLILLSGCAGMGKSTVANGLQKQTGMLMFDAYGSREVMRDNKYFHVSMHPKEKVAKFLACFTFFIDKVKKELPNNAIIFDESIDRKDPPLYTLVAEIAKQHQLPIFLIRLEVPKQIAFSRLMNREKNSEENIEHFKEHFDEYYRVYEGFKPLQKFDHYLSNEGDLENCVGEKLVGRIKKQIEYTEEE